MVDLPPVPVELLGYLLLVFIAGMTVPFRYGIERLNGFGRALAARIPYQPPPGQDPEQALEDATQDDDVSR